MGGKASALANEGPIGPSGTFVSWQGVPNKKLLFPDHMAVPHSTGVMSPFGDAPQADEPPALQDKQTGQPLNVGSYGLFYLLGAGQTSTVFMGDNMECADNDAPPVAVKLLRREAAQDNDFMQIVRDKRAFLERLDHPHVVRLLDHGDHGDDQEGSQYYEVMEYVDGPSLSTVVEQKIVHTLPDGLWLATVVRVGIVMSYLLDHAHRLLEWQEGDPLWPHHDVTLDNLFVTYEGMVKWSYSVKGVGTASNRDWAAEPTLKGEDESQRARQRDVLSVGALLWQLALIRPLPGSAQDAPAPSQVDENIPPALDRIINKALGRIEGEQYSSMAALAAELQTFLISHQDLWLYGDDCVARTIRMLSQADSSITPVPPRTREIMADSVSTLSTHGSITNVREVPSTKSRPASPERHELLPAPPSALVTNASASVPAAAPIQQRNDKGLGLDTEQYSIPIELLALGECFPTVLDYIDPTGQGIEAEQLYEEDRIGTVVNSSNPLEEEEPWTDPPTFFPPLRQWMAARVPRRLSGKNRAAAPTTTPGGRALPTEDYSIPPELLESDCDLPARKILEDIAEDTNVLHDASWPGPTSLFVPLDMSGTTNVVAPAPKAWQALKPFLAKLRRPRQEAKPRSQDSLVPCVTSTAIRCERRPAWRRLTNKTNLAAMTVLATCLLVVTAMASVWKVSAQAQPEAVVTTLAATQPLPPRKEQSAPAQQPAPELASTNAAPQESAATGPVEESRNVNLGQLMRGTAVPVSFAPGSDEAIVTDGMYLLRLAQVTSRNFQYRVRVVGHASPDEATSDRTAMQLARARARAVAQMLTQLGEFPMSRVLVRVDNATAEELAEDESHVVVRLARWRNRNRRGYARR
jgi:serine/threonine protein kinase/outer membrane protein OmpA-like peptidoglycan-associated protein